MHCNYMSVSRSFLCNFHRRHLSMMLDHHSMVSKKTHYAQITLGAWTLWRLNFTLRYFGSPTWSLGANTARLFVSVGRCGEQVHRCNLWWWSSTIVGAINSVPLVSEAHGPIYARIAGRTDRISWGSINFVSSQSFGSHGPGCLFWHLVFLSCFPAT